MFHYIRHIGMTQTLSAWDIVLTPIFLLILIIIAREYRNKKYPPGHILRPYYMPGLLVKFAGVLLIALVYEFYYKDGDTFHYFFHAKFINAAMGDSIGTWLKLLAGVSPEKDPSLYPYVEQMWWYKDASTHMVIKFSTLLGLLTGTTYIPIGLLFAYIAYTGIWAMFKTFVGIYPEYHKQLAFSFLFIPSIIIWGSSIFKDTLCMFALGWLVFASFRIFIHKDFSVKNILILSASFYLVLVIKLYILMAFVPAITLWLLLTYSARVQTKALRYLLIVLLLGINLGGFLFFMQKQSNALGGYSLENIAGKANTTRGWIMFRSGDEGSGYDLGEIPPTIPGMLSKFPSAVAVTLYRPFLWEIRKPIVLLSALESAMFIYLTFIVLLRMRFKAFTEILNDPNLAFFLIYTIIFAFAVGISTGNFGTLSRYKIPCMPFFAALLMILYAKSKVPNKVISQIHENKRPVHHFA